MPEDSGYTADQALEAALAAGSLEEAKAKLAEYGWELSEAPGGSVGDEPGSEPAEKSSDEFGGKELGPSGPEPKGLAFKLKSLREGAADKAMGA